MIISKYKTSVSNEEDAERIISLVEPFFYEGILSFDLQHADKTLSIESHYDEYHPEFVIEIITQSGFNCVDISNHPNYIK
jgi:hypothetical protein